ncbi:MAG: 2-C-methyl-D-erythritol 4-phosphate cytidylyltransferase [Bacteroidetes Order II. Incertae sedis bacterium]|nr:2-C-methyl-D-erythritol 4-phosphate cytidylyltransferase [Bacteroidetes Order II. bacterium]
MMDSRTPSTSVVIPAGGRGTRLGGLKKQYRLLGGVPLLVRSTQVFESCDEVGEVVLVCPPGEESVVEAWQEEYGLSKIKKIVSGGVTRQESVQNGLQVIDVASKVVLVHDAVRPFIQPNDVTLLIQCVAANGAASLAIPVADTLRKVEGSKFADSVPRDGLFRMQTPQGFLISIFRHAHQLAAQHGWNETDDVALVQRAGYSVNLESGSSWNLKITTPEDWAFAEVFWPLWQQMIKSDKLDL